ncbi:MAG: hypothetical protein NZ900_07825 [Synergistetes bacterium]|nr:hypothetical protein [Synergistota bacterium]MDW8192828.1 hypothetical protein [Synergistota bacterium]
MRRISMYATILVAVIVIMLTPFSMAKEKSPAVSEHEKALSRWEKTIMDPSSRVIVKVTYYSMELIRAIVAYEAEKNLWTKDEEENFKYRLLENLKFADCLPFKIEITNNGPAMHMGPFDKKIKLVIDNKTYSPIDYDKVFNFKLIGSRDGMVFFPRRDEKTGKEIITPNTKMLTLVISKEISPLTDEKGFDFIFRWENPYEKIPIGEYTVGEAKIELERLYRRVELLEEKKKDLLKQIQEIEKEVESIKARIAELEKIIYKK